jgi:hypothetical protein
MYYFKNFTRLANADIYRSSARHRRSDIENINLEAMKMEEVIYNKQYRDWLEWKSRWSK